jgi:hypothetical protein
VFNPSKEDVRRFFCEAWHKHRQGSLLTALETLAVDWILQHPEYQDELSDTGAAVTRDYGVEDGRTNPFLHLSMHLAIAEQLSTNQPPGICSAFRRLVERRGGEHEAAKSYGPHSAPGPRCLRTTSARATSSASNAGRHSTDPRINGPRGP